MNAPHGARCLHCQGSIKKGAPVTTYGGWYAHPKCHADWLARQ